MVGFGIVVPVLPLYTERFGASPITIGALLAVYSGLGELAGVPEAVHPYAGAWWPPV